VASTTDVIFWGSLAVLFALAVRAFRRSRHLGQFLVWVAVLAACGLAYYFTFDATQPFQSKGEQSSAAGMIALYIFMVAGMGCHYLYSHFMKPEREREFFDFGLFIAPIFASPLIFAPLWTAFQNAGVTLTGLRFGAFLVAFQNGFFWKEFFDNRRRRRS
jgi:hypothetical protein